mgnify:CR=1 FL=1
MGNFQPTQGLSVLAASHVDIVRSVAERFERRPAAAVKLAEKFHVLQSQRVDERAQDVDHHAENMAAEEDQQRQDPAHVSGAAAELGHQVDDHRHGAADQPQGEQAAVAEHVAQIAGDVVQAQPIFPTPKTA